MYRALPPLSGVAAALALVMAVPVTEAQEAWSRAGGEARVLVLQGDYEEAIGFAESRSGRRRRDPQVMSAWMDALTAIGQYARAGDLAIEAAEIFDGYIPSQVQAIEVLRSCGRAEEAAELLRRLDQLAKRSNPDALNAEELVALGRAALLLGAEPKLVLERFYQRARKLEERGWLADAATAEMAIGKGDYALAARVLNDARTRVGPLSELIHLQARAHSPSDRRKSEQFIDEALEMNPRHLPSLLLRAEHAIDFEDYDRAKSVLAEVRETNPSSPGAWSLEAAIFFILDRDEDARAARERALEPWSGNPEVDYMIGHKLSQMRRFEEGADFLRRALEKDPGHLPSKKALGQDLLRLGEEGEGWRLIGEVAEADPYDVEVYNLMLLKDELAGFETLEEGGFMVRMRPNEAAVYGARVLEILKEGESKLGSKYGFHPSSRVVVDFFPDQQDFAVRTLGIPGGLGIVGACFGNVVAMNSPGSPGAMGSNWESTLWHEFCHTITLGATESRIPRWLTEGISVYEERLRDPSSASRMTPAFRNRLNGAEGSAGLIPIADLSAALTAFSDPETVGFAYHQASLVVEYMIETWGEDRLRQVLSDLRSNGVVDEVLAKRMATIGKIDEGFARYAASRASATGPEADWSVPDQAVALQGNATALAEFLAGNPDNLWALGERAAVLFAEGKWEECKVPARRMIELHPDFTEEGNPHEILARACRALGDEAGEREALREWSSRDGDAIDAFLRLSELDLAAEDWEAADWSARRVLAVNPMLRTPHRTLGLSAERRGADDLAVRSYESLLRLDPVNPADVHLRLGNLQRKSQPDIARRHALLAIEEAPRFREAHRLLRDLNAQSHPSEP